MFPKDKEDKRFQKQYCIGFGAGKSLVEKMSPDRWELTKEVLHAMILEQPKNVTFHSLLTGFCYEIENVRSKERNAQRLKEIQTITRKCKTESRNEVDSGGFGADEIVCYN
ncbi:MAG: hypothetical protein GKR88_15365 [Flavobacteriaceae bacterium]|nr:MAG: hypothetical protein GKR88_15365 [Flavobacteriaceae bacterium]